MKEKKPIPLDLSQIGLKYKKDFKKYYPKQTIEKIIRNAQNQKDPPIDKFHRDILSIIYTYEGINFTQIVEGIKATNQTTTNKLKDLVEKKLITKEFIRNPNNKNRGNTSRYELTKKGFEALVIDFSKKYGEIVLSLSKGFKK